MLSATDEALLYATLPDELYQRVCDASVHECRFLATTVCVPDAETDLLMMLAASGLGPQQLRQTQISIDPHTAEGEVAARVTMASGARRCRHGRPILYPRPRDRL